MPKHNFFKLFIFSAILLFGFLLFPNASSAANLYWIGASGASNNTAANWSTTDPAGCSGTPSVAVPGTSDIIIFDPDCNNNMVLDVSESVAGVSIVSGYDGTITQAASVTLTVGSSNYSQADGTFTGSNAAITFNGSFTLSSGIFTSTSGTLTVGSGNLTGNWTHTAGGTFNHNNGTVRASGYTNTWDVATSETFYNLTVDLYGDSDSGPNYPMTIASGDTLIVANTFTHTDGEINTGTIEAQGNVVIGTWTDGGSATISFLVSGDQTITGNGGYTVGLNINKPSGTVSAGSTNLLVKKLYPLQRNVY